MPPARDAQAPIQLTEVFLRKLKPGADRREITDSVERGLRVRISKDGAATFILKARDASNALKTVTLGRYPELGLKEARLRAADTRRALREGVDVNAAKRERRRRKEPADVGDITLRALVGEFELAFAASRKMWAKAGPKSERSQARRVVEAVFEPLLEHSAESVTADDLAKAMAAYRPKRASAGKSTANGQVSRARAYLMGVLDWGAGRKRFAKAGAGRPDVLVLADMTDVFDPAKEDHTITGERDRVLLEEELRSVLPLLAWPAPIALGLKVEPSRDFRPVAMRFMLLTAARREEVVAMRRRDVDLGNRVWRKPHVKSTRGAPRGQTLPLSDAALELLVALPHFPGARPDALVFPNSTGGKLGNWQRFQDAVYRASGTSGWHRHDLRRTAATLMQSIGVPVFVVDHILAHANPLRREQLSGAASAYLRLTTVLKNARDPQAEALDRLAEVLAMIEKKAADVA